MKKVVLFILVIGWTLSFKAQSCDPDSLQTIITRASLTDPNIAFELKQHYSYFNPTCISRNTLLIHLGGSYGKPGNYLLFPELAGNNGFNVINLHYPNTVASKTACVILITFRACRQRLPMTRIFHFLQNYIEAPNTINVL